VLVSGYSGRLVIVLIIKDLAMFLEVQTGHNISLKGHAVYFPAPGARKPDKDWCIDLINNNAYSLENAFHVVQYAFKNKKNRKRPAGVLSTA